MNAYDDADGNVVIDLCVYDRMFDIDILGPFGDNLARSSGGTIKPADSPRRARRDRRRRRSSRATAAR